MKSDEQEKTVAGTMKKSAKRSGNEKSIAIDF